nr:protein phosphatase 2C domain-containing protein [Duganella fentianensis]
MGAPDLNEDAWSVDERTTHIALSDGASESYDSKRWAQLLVQRYADDPCTTEGWLLKDWVMDAVAAYENGIDFDALSWSKQLAFERGSFATLLTLELAENGNEVEVLSIGDCLAVHYRQGAVVFSYPFTSPEEFEERPQLLSTLRLENAFLADSDFFKQHTSKTWHVEPGDIIYLATDAVGQWLLREASADVSSFDSIQAVTTEAEFAELVLNLRAERRIKLDDSTILRLVVEND